jgi:hypothetical protein
MSADEIPEELWLKILATIPRRALRSIFSANRAFNRISRPLVFAEFQLNVYGIPTGGEAEIPHERVEKVKERIDFWLSEAIAPLVRSCWVYLIPPPRPVVDDDDQPTPDVLNQRFAYYLPLDHFFGHIHHLSGLRDLHLSVVAVPENALASIHGLPSLQHLSIYQCWVRESEEHGSSNLASDHCLLSELSLSAYEPQGSQNQIYWSTFFNARHLHHLTLGANLGWWAQDPNNVPVFENVSKLTIHWHDQPIHPNFGALLVKFPAVEDLGLEPDNSLPDMLFSDGVPGDIRAAFGTGFRPRSPLRRLRGTLPAVAIFSCDAAARALTHLELTTGIYYRPEQVIQQLSTSSTVTCVSLTLSNPDILALNTIVNFFPRLMQLCLKIDTELPVSPVCPLLSESCLTHRLFRQRIYGATSCIVQLSHRASPRWSLTIGPIPPTRPRMTPTPSLPTVNLRTQRSYKNCMMISSHGSPPSSSCG